MFPAIRVGERGRRVLALGGDTAERAEAADTGGGLRPTVLRRRRPLPGGRAVVGGFLVSLAALGVFASYTTASKSHLARYVVASTDLVVGQRISPRDLAVEPMQLPTTLAEDDAFGSPSALAGAVVVGPVRAGELVQASDVVEASGAPRARTLSFSIDASRAVNGTLQVGDTVDAIATFGTGSGASTVVAAQDLRVVALSTSAAGLTGQSPSDVVTVSVARDSDILALVQAVNAGQLVLVRATGTPDLPPGSMYNGPAPVGGAAQ
jgi:Flp pilus assembly protein CpaB